MEHLRKDEVKYILGKFARGEASPVEEKQFNLYLKSISDYEYEELLSAYHQLLGDDIPYNMPDAGLLERIKLKIQEKEYLKPVGYSLWMRFAAAALVTMIAATGLYFYVLSVNRDRSRTAETAEIAMGQNKAVLTLADGRRISLNEASNGEIANQSGIKITKSANGQLIYNIDPGAASVKTINRKVAYNTISTPRGGQYQVNLPDGTRVWLNASSSLTYPTQFATSGRHVTLSGEAYFEVAKIVSKVSNNKNKRVSFLVQTDNQEVEVLGTHFSVNAYPDETSTKTTLLEGSVRVVAKDIRSKYSKGIVEEVLMPGEQASIEAGKIIVRKVEALDAIAWKEGYLQFQDENIRSIMRKIERAYDVEVQYQGEINDEAIGGEVAPKRRKLSEVLTLLEATDQFKFKVEGRRITVMP
jgi:transmembrane sensor